VDEPDLLEVQDLHTQLPTADGLVRAVEGVSFHVRSREVVALVGESGSGKTMTALSIMQLLPPPGQIVGGRILLRNRDLVGLPETEMRAVRGRHVGMIFQDPMTFLNPLMRVGEQLTEGLKIHQKLTSRQAQARAVEVLRQVRIPEPERLVRSYPHELSGGMRQRILIGIAISCRPWLLIADEPTTALDVTIQAQVMKLLVDIHHELDTSILLITHDLGLVAEHCDRVYVMYAGQIVESGDVFSVFGSPKHPYTAALLKSTLSIDHRVDVLYRIEGQPPSLIRPPAGCRFHPRCPRVMAKCASLEPPSYEFAEGQSARCWLHESIES
jgi:oligopeptide/dipeptide ABC transporter ATP-binding protein